MICTLTQYCAGDKIENEIGWACGAYGWGEGVYRVLVGKPEASFPPVSPPRPYTPHSPHPYAPHAQPISFSPMGRPRSRWVDNIRMDLQELGFGYMDWIVLAQDTDWWRTLVSAAMNLRVPWNAGNFLTSCKPVSSSRRTLHHGVSEWVSEWVETNFSLQSVRIRVLCIFKPAYWNFSIIHHEQPRNY